MISFYDTLTGVLDAHSGLRAIVIRPLARRDPSNPIFGAGLSVLQVDIVHITL
jgi:hypothetical protein